MDDMNSTEQLNLTRDLILKKFHPDQYESEQLEKQKKLADLLAFVDGVVSQHNLLKKENENRILSKSSEPSVSLDDPAVQRNIELRIAKLKAQGFSKDEILLKLLSEYPQ